VRDVGFAPGQLVPANMAEAAVRAGRVALRTCGVRAPGTATRLSDGHVRPSLRSFVSGAQEVRMRFRGANW
jgi:hypothetical protein